jgi:hypothetical protein
VNVDDVRATFGKAAAKGLNGFSRVEAADGGAELAPEAGGEMSAVAFEPPDILSVRLKELAGARPRVVGATSAAVGVGDVEYMGAGRGHAGGAGRDGPERRLPRD